MYFIIRKLLGIPEIRSQVLLRMHIVKNCTKQTAIPSWLLYSLSIILFFENSSSKASGLLFIFCSRKYRSCPLFKQQDRYAIPVSLIFLIRCFSVEEYQKSLLWKPDLMSMASHQTHFLVWKRNPPSNRSLLVQKLIVRILGPLSCLYRLYLPLIEAAHVGQFVQKNVDR